MKVRKKFQEAMKLEHRLGFFYKSETIMFSVFIFKSELASLQNVTNTQKTKHIYFIFIRSVNKKKNS